VGFASAHSAIVAWEDRFPNAIRTEAVVESHPKS